jgi:putative transposase
MHHAGQMLPFMSLLQRHWPYRPFRPWLSRPTYFVTISCAAHGTNTLCSPAISNQLFAAIDYYQTLQRWHVSLALLMPDHVHALVSSSENESIAASCAAWKRFTARDTNIRWQNGIFNRRVTGRESLEEGAFDIRMTPVRKGLVAQPQNWPFLRRW